MRRALFAQLGLGARAALVGGVIFGLREGLLALQKNAFAFASEYLLLYALVPILFWVLLALILIVPPSLLLATLGVRDGRGLWRYAALLGTAAAASVCVPWANEIAAHLGQVGGASTASRVLLVLMTGAAVVVAALVCGAAGAWYETRTRRPLRYAAAGGLALCLVSLVPVVSFFAAEQRWGAAPEEPASPIADGDEQPNKPNIVFLSIDTLRADVLGSYGHGGGLTPNLDRLASAGMRFTNAFSSSPWTLPAMASVFTGLDARHHGAGRVTQTRDPLGRSPMPSTLWSLTRALRRGGYHTAAIVTNPYLALRYGFGEGFDTYENLSILSEVFIAFQDTTLLRLAASLLPDWMPGDRSRFVTERAVDWLGTRPRQPFFLWVHYIDPHAPYVPGTDTRINSFRGDSLLGGDGGGDFTMASPDIARLRSGEIRPSPEQKRRVRQLYEGEVGEVDAAAGEVLRALDSMDLTASTLVVCFSDHGEEFWEHGGVEHGRTVYDEVVRVPLIMRWPARLDAGAVVPALARLTDVAPTVLELLGWSVPAGLDGIPLAAPGAAGDERNVLIANMHFAEERVGLRTPTRKYVRWEIGKEEAYDLVRDPGELVDLAGVENEIGPLRSVYERTHSARQARPPEQQTAPPSGATREALRALGYLD